MLTESWVEGKSVEEKDAQPTERTAALWGLSSKIDSRIWVNFTRNELRLGSRHQEPPHRCVKEFGYSWLQRRLTWAKEKKNWTVAQWSKVLFSDESKFCISFGNQGPRVWTKGGEVHSQSCLKSSVKFPQSVMIWGAVSSAGVGPLCFLKTNVTAPVYQEILEHFMLLSADHLFKDDFIFQQDLAPAHTAKSTKSWLRPWCWCVWLASKLFRSESYQEENEKQEIKKCRWAEGHCQINLGFHTTSAVPQTDHLHATLNWGSN